MLDVWAEVPSPVCDDLPFTVSESPRETLIRDGPRAMRDEFETETLSGRAIAEVAHLLQKLKSIITRSKGYQSRHFRLIEFQVLVPSC